MLKKISFLLVLIITNFKQTFAARDPSIENGLLNSQ
jgi:hypothetical protein